MIISWTISVDQIKMMLVLIKCSWSISGQHQPQNDSLNFIVYIVIVLVLSAFFNRTRISVRIRILVEPKIKICTSVRIREMFGSQVLNRDFVGSGKTLKCIIHGVVQKQGYLIGILSYRLAAIYSTNLLHRFSK